MRLREVATLWLALLSAGCETAPDLQHPRFYLSDGISFRYPGNWSVTEDVGGPDVLTYRNLFIESSGSAIVVVQSYEPPIDKPLEDYAAEFHRAELESLGELARIGPLQPFDGQAGAPVPVVARIGGLPREGVEYVFSIVALGAAVPHKLRAFKVETDSATTFLVVQAATEDWSSVAPGLDLVLESFEVLPFRRTPGER